MIAPIVAAGLEAAALILDARPPAQRCPVAIATPAGATVDGTKASGEDITVCARSELPGTRLPATIEGVAAVVLVEPGGPDDLECNPSFIARAGISGREPIPLARIGPIQIEGSIAPVGVVIAGRYVPGNVRWSDRTAVADADCIVGPGGLPQSSVRFVLGPPRADATDVVLPFHRPSYGRTYARWRVGRYDLAVRFELEHRRTVLTASSTIAVAPILLGSVTGDTLDDEISWTVKRPVRRLTLGRPFVIGNVTIREPYARVSDYGRAANVRTINPDEIGADDILVSAKRSKPGRSRLVRVGHDDLARCVAITIDRRHRQMTLTC